jgi:hypothetical protein
MKFKSAIGWWYYALIIGVVAYLIVYVVPLVQSGQASFVQALGVIAAALGLPVWLMFGTYYYVGQDILRIRSGPFTWTIALDTITDIRPSRAPWSSPALSMDRLAIHYGNGKRMLVSPADKAGFLKAISPPP